jgi:hypothetical protein
VHIHEIVHWPKTTDGSGYAVCSCGATQWVQNGKPGGGWHTCALCTHAFGLPESQKKETR